MDHQLFAALFVLALIGQHLASAAPLSDTHSDTNPHHQRDGNTNPHHQGDGSNNHHHQGHHSGTKSHHKRQHSLSGRTSVREIENILKELDQGTTVLIAEKDKVIEIYPEQRELPAGTEDAPALRRQRRSTKRRSRRSAALLLHATLRMCDLHPLHCQSIMLQRDNVRVNIRLVDQ